jgi:hypothetical protein
MTYQPPDPYADCICDDCPRCKQPAGTKCLNPQTGRTAHIPCIARISSKVVDA